MSGQAITAATATALKSRRKEEQPPAPKRFPRAATHGEGQLVDLRVLADGGAGGGAVAWQEEARGG